MPPFNIEEKEWKLAIKLLSKAADGSKLPYSGCNENGQFTPRKSYQGNPKPYETTHSFIKINEKIYAIAQGKSKDAVIADGSVDKVKYAVDINGELLLIKISVKSGADEASIMTDLSQSVGSCQRLDKSKYYTAVTFLGTNLKRYLLKNDKNLDDASRLDIAIKLSWQMHRLHNGLNSKSGTAYAHMDLKSDNITIDQNNEVHIIDYGLAETQPKEIGRIKTGAASYMPYAGKQKLTKEQIDIVSLKRTLFMPSSYYCSKGWVSHSRQPFDSVLTEKLLTNNDLDTYINTYAIDGDEPDYIKNSISAMTISALLISTKLKLNISNEQIKNDDAIAHTITGLYFTGKESEIDETLANPQKIKIFGALQAHNIIDELEAFENDKDFCQAINQAENHHTCLALVHLKKMGLQKYYNTVYKSEEATTAILNIANYYDNVVGIVNSIKVILNDENNHYAKAINYLEKNELHDCYSNVIENRELAISISEIVDDTIKQAVSITIKSGGYSSDDIFSITQNKPLAEVINAMRGNPFFGSSLLRETSNYADLINNPYAVKAYSNCCDLGLKDIHIARILASTKMSEALNILYEAKVINLKNSSMLIHDSSMAAKILKLNKLNLHELYSKVMDTNELEFTYKLEDILKSKFSDKITVGMLQNEYMVKLLSNLRYSVDEDKQSNALFVLFGLGLINKDSHNKYKNHSYIYKLINFLHKNKLDKHIKRLFDKPINEYCLHEVLKQASDIAEISFVMANVSFFEESKESIHSTKELYARKAIKESGVDLEKTLLSNNEVEAINQLIQTNSDTKKYIKLALSSYAFNAAINASNKAYHTSAVLIVSDWKQSDLIELLINEKSSLLAKMITTSKNEDQGIEFVNLYTSLNKLKEKKEDLEARDEIKAVNTCNNLIIQLEGSLEAFFDPRHSSDERSHEKFNQLKDDCHTAISESRNVLEKHRGIMEAFDTFLTVLASLVIAYPLVYLYQKHKNINYTFFKPDSAKIIDEFESSFKNISASNP